VNRETTRITANDAMTSSSSTSTEDLSRFATSTASSSKTSLELIVDQEKDMSVSTLGLCSRINPIFIYYQRGKKHLKLIELCMLHGVLY
jgi:hypothetical protein